MHSSTKERELYKRHTLENIYTARAILFRELMANTRAAEDVSKALERLRQVEADQERLCPSY